MLTVVLAAAAPARGADDPTMGAVATANTAFAVDLYRQLSPAPGNLIFSPYSISDVLAMAQVGARGSTATEMATVLHLSLPRDQVAAGFAGLGKHLGDDANDGVMLVTANSLWTQVQYPLSDGYLQMVRTQFGAEAMPADFIRNAEVVRNAINAWVDAQTRGKITDLISPGMLSDQTRMVLCNAIYFKGRWERQFKKLVTEPAPFHLSRQASVTVPTMSQTAKFRTAHLDGCGLLELPYQGQQLSMVIILPDAVDGLAGIERQMTGESLHLWLAQLDFGREVKTAVYLPRFTARETFRLASELSRLGMRSAFNPAAADFSGMTGTRDLFLSDVVHKAYVEVNEEGTEAAAATGAIVAYLGTSRVPEFRVDHPFVFLIRDNATGAVLFLGRIVDPR